jgi:hypothetical protein
MDLKETRIAELQKQHDLPTGILAQCVDETGTVDTARLGIALQTREFTKSGMSAVNEGLITALSDKYYEAEARRDPVSMISLKNAIAKIGGQLMARKKV